MATDEKYLRIVLGTMKMAVTSLCSFSRISCLPREEAVGHRKKGKERP
jgi:hypothetical protein